jgi:hypothetical protein
MLLLFVLNVLHFVQEARTQGTEDATETRTEAVSGSVI